MSKSDSTPDAGLDRRALLQKGSALLVGAAGLSAAGVVGAAPAGAAPGDPVLQGQPNSAGAAATELTSTSDATLKLDNAGDGAAMQLMPAPDTIDFDAYFTNSQSGDVLNAQGALLFTHDPDFVGEIYTDVWANHVVPVAPQRVLDTRTAAGRARIVAVGTALDSQGRLLAGRTIEITLEEFVFLGSAAFFNITVVSPTRGGFATVWPTGPLPGTSSINYVAGQTLANGLVCGLSEFDTVRIYSYKTTHVLLDVTAFFVGSAGQIEPSILGGAPEASALSRKSAPRRDAPAWVRAGVARRA